jgi:uncharacterized protein YbjT (DUF2867 family)
MRFAILGATGRTGKHLVTQALMAGYLWFYYSYVAVADLHYST